MVTYLIEVNIGSGVCGCVRVCVLPLDVGKTELPARARKRATDARVGISVLPTTQTLPCWLGNESEIVTVTHLISKLTLVTVCFLRWAIQHFPHARVGEPC